MTSRILVIDDDPHLLQNLKELLALHAYDVTPVQNPQTALDLLKNNPNRFDLIILDWKLKAAIDGDTLLQMLKYRFAESFKTPVICMSAHTAVSSKHFIRLGAWDTIKKPFAGEDLLEKIAQALHKAPPDDPHRHAPADVPPDIYQKNYMARKIIKALSPDKPLAETAREVGCSERSLYRWLKKIGIHQFLHDKERRG